MCGECMLVLKQTAKQLFSHCTILHFHQPQGMSVPRYSTTSLVLSSVLFCFVLSILISGAVPHCGLICISLMTYDEHLFMCFICYPYIFFGGVSGQVSCPFFLLGCFVFILLSFEKSLYILDVGPLLLIFSPQLKFVFSFS